jgi:hypothetical protein
MATRTLDSSVIALNTPNSPRVTEKVTFRHDSAGQTIIQAVLTTLESSSTVKTIVTILEQSNA